MGGADHLGARAEIKGRGSKGVFCAGKEVVDTSTWYDGMWRRHQLLDLGKRVNRGGGKELQRRLQ